MSYGNFGKVSIKLGGKAGICKRACRDQEKEATKKAIRIEGKRMAILVLKSEEID
jgi:hypothetical protein